MKISKLNKSVQKELFNDETLCFYILKTPNNEKTVCFEEDRFYYVEWVWTEEGNEKYHDVVISENNKWSDELDFTTYDSIKELKHLDGILIEKWLLWSLILALNFKRDEKLMSLTKVQARKAFFVE